MAIPERHRGGLSGAGFDRRAGEMVDVEEFEASVAHVLAGGTLDQHGHIHGPLERYSYEIEGSAGPLTVEGWRETRPQ